MIVPRYWAEERVRERVNGKQITVRRFGWSNACEEEAKAGAQARAQDALRRIVAGEKLSRRERKLPYNGADGMPIREEIVSQHDEVVVTRNGYGALCLNTPNTLFVDIDFEVEPPLRLVLWITLLLVLCAIAVGWLWHSWQLAAGLGVLALFIGYRVTALGRRLFVAATGGAEGNARRRIHRFLRAHADAHLRLYKTPAGFRVLAMHRTFDPGEPAVAETFRTLGADPIYARMCLNQKCFRARVSPKPWRIGMGEHIRPRPGVWPVAPERLPARMRWIEKYEQAAYGYAACRFIESLGGQTVDAGARAVQLLHDELCKTNRDLPIA